VKNFAGEHCTMNESCFTMNAVQRVRTRYARLLRGTFVHCETAFVHCERAFVHCETAFVHCETEARACRLCALLLSSP